MTRGSARTSAGEPSAIFSPWSRTVTRSLMPMTTFMSCSISRIVRPELGRAARGRSRSAGASPRGSCRRSARRAAGAWARWPGRGRSRGGAGRRTAGFGRGSATARSRPTSSSSSMACVVRLRLLAPDRRRAQDRAEPAALEPVVEPDEHVLLGRHVAEQADVLERPGDPEADDLVGLAAGDLRAVEHDPALGRDVQAGDHVEERRLAGAVGPDEADDARRAGS